ncbi:MAG: SRPBCC family protein [Rhodococcus sp. (in: high G+C Gram-positive bacteria)]
MSPSSIGVVARISEYSADDVFARIRDFASFAEHVTMVDYITVTDPVAHDDGTLHHSSSWSTHFRGGLLQWVEHDTVDVAARTVCFEQSSGDLGSFDGRWSVQGNADGTVDMSFDAAVDIGIPSMADMLNPVAAHELAIGVRQIVDGVFGARVVSVEVGAGVTHS